VRLRDDRLLIAFGCVAGIAALTKLQVILLCSVLLVAVAVAARGNFCGGRCCGWAAPSQP
jgi:hypothetical protein